MGVVALSACSKVEKMEDKTSSMERTTKTMSTTTDKMENTTSTMFQQIRSKEAEATRATKIEEILNPSTLMGSKVASACIFFKSFEFQLWDPEVKFDTPAMRQTLLKDAADEFTQRVIDIYTEINPKKLDPRKSVKAHNQEMAFYAIATSLHMNHSFQEGMHQKHPDVKVISMLSLIQGALLKDYKNEHLTEAEATLVSGHNKEMMIELLKARVDMISAMALNNMTDQKKMNAIQLVQAGAFLITGGFVGKVQLPDTFMGSNASTQDTVRSMLEFALDSKRTLKMIGVEKKLHKTIHSALKNIDLGEEISSKSKSDIRVLLTNLLD